MNFFDLLEKDFVFFDGAMGTMLQKRGLMKGERTDNMNLRMPEAVAGVHKLYIDAGSDMFCTNTFSANSKNLAGTGHSASEVINAAVTLGKEVAEGKALAGLDIGPVGGFMEPSGTLTFDEVYGIVKEEAEAGASAGADAAVIETMTNLQEVRASILAIKENTELPIIAMMTFNGNGKTFEGCCVESFAAVADALGVDVVGINCSLLPEELFPTAKKLAEYSSLPLCIKPNAGKPKDADGSYEMTAQLFADQMKQYAGLGVKIVGGCCGTDPEYISCLKETFSKLKPAPRVGGRKIVCSALSFVEPSSVKPAAVDSFPATVGEAIDGYEELDEYCVVPMPAGISDDEGAEIIRRIQLETFLPMYIVSPDGSGMAGAFRLCAGVPAYTVVSGSISAKAEEYGAVKI